MKYYVKDYQVIKGLNENLNVYQVEFSTYLNYCRSLRFEDKPDYSYLRKMFKELFFKEQYELDYMYDWTLSSQVIKNLRYNRYKFCTLKLYLYINQYLYF